MIIETKTGSTPGDSTNGAFYVQFNSPEGKCKINDLDNPKKNDMELGAIDHFSGVLLRPCEAFQPDEISSVTITHWRGDSWKGEYLKISYQDKSFICMLGQMIDNRKSITFPCNAWTGKS